MNALLKNLLLLGGMLAGANLAFSTDLKEDTLSPQIKLDRESGLYKCGEKAVFTISLKGKLTSPETDKAKLKLTNDARDVFQEKELDLSKPETVISGSMDKPGFLRCTVEYKFNGKAQARVDLCAGFDPEKIVPSMKKPADFDKFWEDGFKELANIPADYQLKEIRKDKTAETYTISAATLGGKRVYGFLSIPADKSKKYPVNFQIPSAGMGVNSPVFSKGESIEVIVNVHDNPVGVSQNEFTENYKKMEARSCCSEDKSKCLDGCKGSFYPWFGAENRNIYYFRAPILGICRVLDYVAALPEYDKKEFNMIGHSQGGGMVLLISGLKQDIVTSTFASVPGLCDHAGHEIGRETGWPWIIGAIKGDSKTDKEVAAKRKKLCDELCGYYDACFFAERIRTPIAVVCGFTDYICVPSSVYAAFNSIASDKKKIINAPHDGHAISEVYANEAKEWLKSQKTGKQ